jgi:hypothetical protein
MFLCFQVKTRSAGYLSPIKQGTVFTGSNLVTTMYVRSVEPACHWITLTLVFSNEKI